MRTIIPGVHQVSKSVNSFIVDGDEGVTLIDTGLPKRHGAIIEALGTIGRSESDVTAIVLTHAHVDHFGGAAALKEATGASVYASSVDAPAIRGETETPIPPLMERLPFLKFLSRLLPDAAPVTVDREIDPGNATALPGDLTAIATPGHTPGHLSYLLDRDGGILFVGDAAVSTARGTVKRGWMNRSTPAFDASIRHLAEREFAIACFGHSSPLTTTASDAFLQFAESIG